MVSESDSGPFTVEHWVPHRIRIRFRERMKVEQLRSLIWLLEQHLPGAQVRQTAAGLGLVLSSPDPSQPLEDPVPLLLQLIEQPLAHLNEPPARGLRLIWQRSQQPTLKLLISLAIAGWALPLLPGTPFFLLAWWLGWRPDQPGTNDNNTSKNGATTRAEIGASSMNSAGSGTFNR